ncbi:MAG: ribonuclease D [Geminicoccaceae bacterium]|nr:MAG: ribonuclease D [Geminicoccaceae bacterium]
MSLINTTAELERFVADLAGQPYVTIDTEFMRDRTYYAQLCLVQLGGAQGAIAVDTLAEGLHLEPLYQLLTDERILKVFHAPRQDLEIFQQMAGRLPRPLFDTQLAAMVLGFGDEIGYEALVREVAGANLDKSARFTDWSRRPLSTKQIDYALGDVVHLRVIYEKFSRSLAERGRSGWVDEELAALLEPRLYEPEPDDMWRRLKVKTRDPRFLAVLQGVAAWREREAQRKDLPRNRILRDDVLLDLVVHRPRSVPALKELKRLQLDNRSAETIVAIVNEAVDLPPERCPQLPPVQRLPKGIGPLVDLLKVLLRLASERHDVAQRLIATTSDLEQIAADDDADVPALKGWRREVFGEEALALKRGELALRARGKRVEVLMTPPERAAKLGS